MRKPLALLGFLAIAALGAASCSSATSTPATANAGVEVVGHDGAADIGGNEVVDTTARDESGDEGLDASEDLLVADLATEASSADTGPPDADAETADSEVAACPPGAACSAPCCTSATCDGSGTCVCAVPACDDQNTCTVDLCVAATCTHVPADVTPCDDGDPCTLADACTVGTCKGLAKSCGDNNPCTADGCAGGACSHLPADTSPCDDGLVCTGEGACSGGACSPGQPINCDDGSKCTEDYCEEYLLGCAHYAMNLAGTFCQTAGPCPAAGLCKDGVCAVSAANPCEDANPCTVDSCDPVKGCVFLPVAGTCTDDGNPCTDDVCAGGKCGLVKKDGTLCASGTGCDAAVTCQQGKCVGGQEVWTVEDVDGVHYDSDAPGKSIFPTCSMSAKTMTAYAFDGTSAWQAPMNSCAYVAGLDQGWVVQETWNTYVLLSELGAVVSTVDLASTLDLKYGTVIVSAYKDDLVVLMPVDATSDFGTAGLASVDGKVKKTWSTPKGVHAAARAYRRSGGDTLWTAWASSPVPGFGQNSLYRLNIPTDTFDVLIPAQAVPDDSIGSASDGDMVFAEAPDQTLYVAQTWRTSDSTHPIVVYLWRATSAGETMWKIRLPLPDQPAGATVGALTIGAPSDGTVEILACAFIPNKANDLYNQGCTSWRVASDGHLLWSRDEDQRRRPPGWGGTPLVPAKFGVVGVFSRIDGVVNYSPTALTRSDAYGNITCAESGPCWDKPATYCDDGDPCTNDLCGATWNGCHHEPFADGMPCQPGKTCKKGLCTP